MSPSATFRSYLAGLALTMAPAAPALAGPPVARTAVAFADNLAQKLEAIAEAPASTSAVFDNAWPWGETIPPFGQLWVQYGPFIQIRPHVAAGEPVALRPSEAFALKPSKAFSLVTKS